MPAVMVIALGLTIAGILAVFLVWRELDRMESAGRNGVIDND